MRRLILTVSILVLGFIGCNGCNKKMGGMGTVSEGDLKSELDKVSYILGFSTGKSFSEQSVDVDLDLFMAGVKQGLQKDSESVMNEDQMREVMTSFRTNLMEKRRKDMEDAGKANQKAGEKFMAENKKKEGVVTLPSGLQYKILKEGKGVKPKSDDSVLVEYDGTLLDGKSFDSTKSRGNPATFAVGTTIPGMSEALRLMPVGSEWELYIPSSLAYGTQGAGAQIGPNQTLKFKVTLVSIADEKKATDKKKASAPAKKKS